MTGDSFYISVSLTTSQMQKKMLNVSILEHGNRQPNREQFNDTTIFT